MKVLLVKMSSLGDLVQTLPALTDAAKAVGVRFDWVVEEAFQAVPTQHPAVDRAIPIAWRRWRANLWRARHELRSFFRDLVSEHYDLAIDSQGLLKSALVMSRAQAAETVGFSGRSAREPAASMFYGRVVDVAKGHHATERQRRLFAGAFGYAYDASTGAFSYDRPATRLPHPSHQPPAADAGAFSRGSGRGRFSQGAFNPGSGRGHPSQGAFSPGSARGYPSQEQHTSPKQQHCIFLHGTTWATKLWPEPMWAELARLAKGSNWQPMLPWGNEVERARAIRIADSSGAKLLPAMRLGELMAEIGRASLAIGADSGLAHLATALGVPTVVLHGPTASALTGCRGDHARNLQANFGCSPCLSRSCRYRGAPVYWRQAPVTPPCYSTLEPATVWAVALEALSEPAYSPSRLSV